MKITKYLHPFFLLSTIVVTYIPSHSQSLGLRLEQAMEQQRNGVYFAGVNPFLKDIAHNSTTLLPLLNPFSADSSATVRDFTCELYAAVYNNSADDNAKAGAMTALCAALADSVQHVRNTAAVALEEVPKDAFTVQTKQLVLTSLSAYGEIDEEQVLLTGYLGIEEANEKLQQLKSDPTQENRIRWCCYLALARMRDEPALDFILSATQKQEMNDHVVYNYFPDLVYTRQRKAFDYLVKELFNDSKNCNSPNPNISKEMVCGYRIMEMLTPVIKGFPLKTTAAGTIDSKNYDKALDTARKWFAKHGNDYEIKDDTF